MDLQNFNQNKNSLNSVPPRYNFRRFFSALIFWSRPSDAPEIKPSEQGPVLGKNQGFVYKNRQFTHYTNLDHNETAFFNLTFKQKLFFIGLALVLISAFLFNWHAALLSLLAMLVVLYFLDSLFNAFLIFRSFAKNPEIKISLGEVQSQNEAFWPSYTVFCPLYKEWQVVPQFVRAISALDYPKAKLQVLLLLEEDDTETVKKIQAQNLPGYFEIIIVPHSQPKTKPKAMNYGLKFATGEYLVIYDAEDVPEPDQLKKAVLAFKKAPKNTACIQAKLNFYNPHQNILTRVFAAEYSLWFDLVLTGLQSIGAPIPLGGTSNHFQTQRLRDLDGWDAFNVTEDCDLGLRLAKRGYKTAIVDSTTLEEANSDFLNWYRQRSRWIKGYMQTYLVHMRNPREFLKKERLRDFLMLQLTIGGKILSLFINPLMWLITLAYFLFRSHVGTFIESFFPGPILYIGVFSLVFGNFLYLYYYMIGCAKRGQYALIKYVYLVPLYWLFMSVASWQAFYELLVKPHYWAKTLHGLHIEGEEVQSLAINFPGTAILPEVDKQPVLASRMFTAGFDGIITRSEYSGKPISAERPTEVFQSAEPLNQPQFAGKPIFTEVLEKIIEPSELFNEPKVTVPKLPVFARFKIIVRIKTLFASNKVSGGALVVAMLAANFLNLLFNVFLGRTLTLEDFATVTLFNTVLNILAVALSALGGAVTYKTAFLLGQNEQAATNGFAKIVKNYVWQITAVLSAAWLVLTPVVANFFHISNLILVMSFTPVLAFGSIAAVQNGFLRGRFRFALLGQAIVLEAASKLVVAMLFVYLGLHGWASLSIPASIAISFLATGFFARSVRRSDERDLGLEANRPASEAFPAWYFGMAIITGLASAAFLNIDVLLAKHYLDPSQAGAYALLSLVGKMVFFMGALLSPFLSSVISRHEGAGTDADNDFHKLLAGTAGLSLVSVLGLGIFGRALVPLLFGSRSLAILPQLLPYCAAMGLFAVSSSVISYHIIKKQYSFAFLMLGTSILLVLGIMVSHESIAGFTRVMLYAALLNFVLVAGWHKIHKNFGYIYQYILDMLGVFVPLNFATDSSVVGDFKSQFAGKKVLMFNWRDTKHAYAGGAEVYVHELARRWVAEGHQVTLFCGNDQKSLREETLDGVRVVRRGGFYMVYFWAFIYYMLKFRGKFDVILDCHNGIPFFAPLFTKEKVFCLMHHVHQDVFRRHLPQPLASFAAFLENTMMPLIYRHTKFITISNSSKEGILGLGLAGAGLDIVHPGIDAENLSPGNKYEEPLVVYLGRLKAYKSVDVLLRAFKAVTAQLPNAKLVIAGDGEERGNLERLTDELGLEDSVAFCGKITERQKTTLLRRAWVFCNPSMMEGWGITTIEANACGVPVVAADVPGLRDSVKNPHTGYLVEHGNHEAFAEKILQILLSPELQTSMGENSINWAANFNWDKSSAQALKILYG